MRLQRMSHISHHSGCPAEKQREHALPILGNTRSLTPRPTGMTTFVLYIFLSALYYSLYPGHDLTDSICQSICGVEFKYTLGKECMICCI